MATGFRRLRAPGVRFEKCRGMCFWSRSHTGSRFGSDWGGSEIHKIFDFWSCCKLRRSFSVIMWCGH